MTGCLLCARGLVEECDIGHPELSPDLQEENKKPAVNPNGKQGRPELSEDEIRDPRSTYRKRAQRVAEERGFIRGESDCEWRGKKNCGLVRHPVVGCKDGIYTEAHHINKIWSDLRYENIVAICRACHSKTHALINPCVKGNAYRADELEICTPEDATQKELDLWNDPSKRHLVYTVDHKSCEVLKKLDQEEDDDLEE